MLDRNFVESVPHTSERSLSDQLDKGVMARRDFIIPNALLPDGIGRVRLPGGNVKIPAAVAVRCLLATQVPAPDKSYVCDRWQVVYEPYYRELLERSLALGHDLTLCSVPPAVGMGEKEPAKTDIPKMMNDALKELSNLRPPYEGAMLMVVLWQDRLGVVDHDFIMTAQKGVRRAALRARQHNRQVRASSAPFGKDRDLFGARVWNGGPLDLFGVRVWGQGDLVEVPWHPEKEEWVIRHRETIEAIIKKYFKPALLSLWKATFAEPEVARVLRPQGYVLGEDDRTQFGAEGLRELIEQRTANPRNHTVFADPELLAELEAQFVERL